MINHDHKLIFIHIPRTGGTSIEYFFTKETEVEAKHTFPVGWKNDHPEEWETYFKFSSVRNPWDRAVSQWAIEKQWYPAHFDKSFKEYVKYPQGFPLQPQLWFLTEPSCVAYSDIIQYVEDNINCILRFEDLEAEFAILCDHLGVECNTLPHKYDSASGEPFVAPAVVARRLPHKYASAEVRQKRPYQEYYDQETKDIISRIYNIDIEYFEYEF